MRYEIAVLLKSLEEYHSHTGGYHPVDTETIGAAIEKLRAAYRQNLPDLHEETIVEIMHAKTVMLLATALSDYDRDIAVALHALRLSEQQKDEQDPQHPAFHISWHDERWKLLNFYGQLLEEEKDAIFQLALDALRAREVSVPHHQENDQQRHMAQAGIMDMQAAIVLSAANKAKAVRDIRTVVVERQWTYNTEPEPEPLSSLEHLESPLTFTYYCWCVADGKILDSYPTTELALVNRWLMDHGLSSKALVWKPL